MKKIFVLFSLMITVLLLVSCTNTHTHQAASDWTSDATDHWHTCSGCEELLDKAAHTFGEWSVVKEATETAKGSEKRSCTECGFEESREIPQLSHTHEYSTQYSTNSTHHWFACNCGEKKDYAEHTGGTATTEELAVCEVCGAPYGELVVVPPHTCSFTNGICECGKSEAGAFDKTIDGDLADWSAEEQAHALKTFGESGTGYSVLGYHKDGKAYFATTIVTAEVTPNSFEIFQKDGATRYIISHNNETGEWHATDGADHLITLYVTETVEDGLNVFLIESLWDFSAFPQEENGNYRIHFAVAAPEKSAASFSDTQIEYWVLYAKNAWNPAWNFELTTTTEFGHEHLLDENHDCIICGGNFKISDLAVNVDGKTDDWNANVLETMLVSYDEEDRWIKQVGFTDDKYLYMFISVAHRDPVGYLNIIVSSDWFGGINVGSVLTLDKVEEAKVLEYKDETGAFTVTDYEFVLSIEKIKAFHAEAVTADGVKIGFDILNSSGENSHAFACSPDKLFMWGIAGYNSWSVAHNFVYGPNGVPHTHNWDVDTELCKLCQAEMPKVQYDINADGDLTDWSSEILATASKTYGDAGNGWEIMGYRDGTIAYLAVTIKTKGAVPALFGLVENSVAGYAEHTITHANGVWTKTPDVILLGSSVNDTDAIDTYVLELIFDLSKVNALASGDYLFGLQVYCEEKSAASYSDSQTGYWVMLGRNAWNSDANLFTITENGITHNHSYGEYSHDSENHFKSCLCGHTLTEAHKGGEATYTEKAICEVCGQPYGELKEITETVITIYFQNNWDWVDINLYCWGDNGSNAEWPGKPMTLVGTYDGKELYKMELDSSVYHSFIFNGINLGWQVPNNRDQSPDLKVADYLDFYASECFYMAWDNGNKIGHCAMSEDALHLHQFNLTHDENQHWLGCECGKVSGQKEDHKGGEATLTEKALCEVCNQPYGSVISYAITADGLATDWVDYKSTALKGWYTDADGRTRGLEYMAFYDDYFIYLYTRTITASNADKGLDIIFNKNGELLSTSMWNSAPGANILEYNFTINTLLENGLYETVSEIVLDKSVYENSNGNVFVGVWFIGCDDAFAPLSWHEAGKTTIWGLNNRCPWWKGTNQQRITVNGFDHYHDLNANNICGWCQETVGLPITVDANSSDWNADILAKTKVGGNISAAGYTDADHLYLYLEVTQTGANEPNYLCIEGTNANGLRNKTGFSLYFDAGTSALRPWCNGWWGCVNFCDCDNGFVKYAMNRTSNDAGQLVIQYELVIDKDLIAKANGEVWIEVSIDDTVAWGSGASLTGWQYMKVTETGIEG